MGKMILAGMTALALGIGGGQVAAQDAPFGTDKDVAYAKLLWDLMKADKLVGDGAIHAVPYAGVEPHGMMLETFYTTASVNGHEGRLVVKRNYGPEGVKKDDVLMDPAKHLGAITVMFQREDGYDADNQNWFWAKYLPDGSLDKNPEGMQLAGRVAKGADAGCIACHSTADGGDYLFSSNGMGMMMK